MEVFSLMMKRNVQKNPDFRYHFGCKELELTHLSFANDLLVLSHGDLVYVIKETLTEFSRVSGLLPNINKSTIFFGNVDGQTQRSILDELPFVVGRLPVRYLGVPLITKKISLAECRSLVDKVKNVVLNWKNKSLSYAGRLQLISSVLASMQVYWASVFLIPKSTIKDIDKVLKGFLWCSGDLQKGKAKVSWKVICTPKCQGSLGFKKLDEWNETLLAKQIWKIASRKESLWVQWVNLVKLKGRSFCDIEGEANDSWMWKVLLNLRTKYRQFIVRQIGNGKNVSASYDKWNECSPLCTMINKRNIYNARLFDNITVADLVKEGQWQWPQDWYTKFPALQSMQVPNLRNDVSDKVVWRDLQGTCKGFSIQQVWKDTNAAHGPLVNWNKVVWFSQCNPAHSFVIWLVAQERLMTQDNMLKWNDNGDLKCSFCKMCHDLHSHLFFQCEFPKKVWSALKNKIHAESLPNNWSGIVNVVVQSNNNNAIRSVLRRIVLAAGVYFVRQERNRGVNG